MESFLWTLVYVLLRQTSRRPGRAPDDEKIFNQLTSVDKRDYDVDGGMKEKLITQFKVKEFAARKSVLIPYETLINSLAQQASDLHSASVGRSFEGYTQEQEIKAIDDNIKAFETFLKKNEETLKKDKFRA